MKRLFLYVALIMLCTQLFTLRTLALDLSAENIDSDFTDTQTPFGTCGKIIEDILANKLELKNSGKEKITAMLNGSLRSGIKELGVLLAVSMVLSIVENLKILSPDTEQAALTGGRIIFLCALLSAVIKPLSEAKEALHGIRAFSQVLTPVLATLLASCGAQGSAASLSPTVSLLSGVLISAATDIIFPLLICGFVISEADTLLPDGKLSGVALLFKSISSWLIGGIFTVFAAVIAIRGLASGISDGISVRGIKYALSSAVPIIGGSVSESLSLVLSSGSLIKNAVGVTGMLAIAGIILAPIVNLLGFMLALRIFSACVRPFAGRITSLQTDRAYDFLKMIAVTLFGVSVLWFIYLGMIIGAGGGGL